MKLIEAAASRSSKFNRPPISHGYAINQAHQRITTEISLADIYQAIADAREDGTLILLDNGRYILDYSTFTSFQDLIATLYQLEPNSDREIHYVILPLDAKEDKKVAPSRSQEFWNSVPSLSRPRS